jgi:hypothetical protein
VLLSGSRNRGHYKSQERYVNHLDCRMVSGKLYIPRSKGKFLQSKIDESPN